MKHKREMSEVEVHAAYRLGEERELYKEMDINGIHVKVYISNAPFSDGSMQRVIDNLITAYEERMANQRLNCKER